MSLKHGHARDSGASPTYSSWENMIARCYQSAAPYYKDYGGRGIIVCARWRDFRNFLADMGERPDGLTLDRYPNPNGNYEPGNCRWATRSEQQRNRRGSYRMGGQPALRAEVAADLGISGAALLYRNRNGLPLIEGKLEGYKLQGRAWYVIHGGYVPIQLKAYADKVGLEYHCVLSRAKRGKMNNAVRFRDLTAYQRQMVLATISGPN